MIVKRIIVPHIRGKPPDGLLYPCLTNNGKDREPGGGEWPLLLREQTSNRGELALLRGWSNYFDQAEINCLKKRLQPASRSPRSPNDRYTAGYPQLIPIAV